jgi:hypothetical protein
MHPVSSYVLSLVFAIAKMSISYSFALETFLKKGNADSAMISGGGHVLCPGRHLAFTEILTFVATVILGLDIKPENGVWPPLERAIYSPSLGVYKPTKFSNVPVVISRRAEHKDKRWRYPTQTAT